MREMKLQDLKSKTPQELLAFADDIDFLGRKLLQDGEHQLLLPQGARILDCKLFGDAEKLRWRLHFKVLKFHFLHDGGDFRGCEKSGAGKTRKPDEMRTVVRPLVSGG